MTESLKWFKLFVFKRKLGIFWFFEGFFKLHSRATEREKDKKEPKKDNFLANRKSLNHFIVSYIVPINDPVAFSICGT